MIGVGPHSLLEHMCDRGGVVVVLSGIVAGVVRRIHPESFDLSQHAYLLDSRLQDFPSLVFISRALLYNDAANDILLRHILGRTEQLAPVETGNWTSNSILN